MEADLAQSVSGLMYGQLLLATALGALLGLERSVIAGKSAGVRTYALVSMGACLFFLVAAASATFAIAAGIITGVGFLGAGLVIKDQADHPHGLTTAAGLWVSAGIGMAVGMGLLLVATFATFLTLFVFNALLFVENRLRKLSHQENSAQ